MLFKIIDCYTKGWQIAKKNIVFLIGSFGGVFLFLEVIRYLSNLAVESLFIGLITTALFVFSICLFYLGITKVMVSLSKDEEASIKDLFSQWNLILNMLFLYVFSIAIFFVIHEFFMFFAEVSGFPNLFALAWIIIVTVVFVVFFSFVNLLMVKYQDGPVHSLRHNLLISKSSLLEIIIFYVIFFIINMVGLMVFYIGLIFTLPLTLLAQAIFLDKLEEL